MQPMQWILVPFGWLFIVAMLAAILIPFLRRRADLITVWTLYLFGSAYFIGWSAVVSGIPIERYQWDFEPWDYMRFVMGAVTFYVVLFFSYYYFKFPRRWAGKRLRKWPSTSVSVLVLLIPFCAFLSLGAVFPPNVPLIGLLLYLLGKDAAITAAVLGFVAWYQQRFNPVLLWTVVVVVLLTLFLSIVGGAGRRQFLNVLLILPICYYWVRLRYVSRARCIAILGSMAAVGVVILAAYSVGRHGTERTMQDKFQRYKELPGKMLALKGFNLLASETTTLGALVAIQHYTRHAEPRPFHTLYFILCSPIPRAYWPGKPKGLGYLLPRESGQNKRMGNLTWPGGIVAAGYHEGGLAMLVLYGLLIGIAIAFLDEMIVQQCNNPYMLAIVCGISAHVIGHMRGDMSTFTNQIMISIAAVLAVSYFGRFFFGTATIYPKVSQIYSRPQPA